MDNRNTVLLVMGSARAARNCPAITAWVEQLAHRQAGFDCEVIDLAAWTLPAGDEPGIPALGHYAQARTRAWSDKVQSASAVCLSFHSTTGAIRRCSRTPSITCIASGGTCRR